MNIWNWLTQSRITGGDGANLASRPEYVNAYRNRLRGHYDAARTTDENERHWLNADYLSPNALLKPAVRARVRARARYEAQQNNSYAKGMILTLANDMVGKGPRLQINELSKPAAIKLQKIWANWAAEIKLAQKLRTMRMAKCVDGEAFALLIVNDKLKSPIKLDIVLIESDRVEEPFEYLRLEDEGTDAIREDEHGNVTHYYVQDHHPGAGVTPGAAVGRWVPADSVLHVFRQDRPEQDRGISEIVTALPLFAMSRRFTLATLAAAETAADFAAVLFTDSPAVNPAQLGEDEWFEAIPVEYRAMVTLPNTWKMQQFKAEHPAATYEMFKREILNEIARCLNMPFNIAAANSSSYNYSSGRLDHQTYFKAIAVERDEWECSVLDKILYAWLWEASDVPGLIPDGAPPFMDWDWQWHWDGREEIDELKSAKAQETRLQSGCTSRIAELQLANIDVDQNDEENARAYGVTVEEYRAALFKKHFGGTSAEESDEQTSEENPPSSEREEDDAEVDGESEDDSSVEAAGGVLDRW